MGKKRALFLVKFKHLWAVESTPAASMLLGENNSGKGVNGGHELNIHTSQMATHLMAIKLDV